MQLWVISKIQSQRKNDSSLFLWSFIVICLVDLLWNFFPSKMPKFAAIWRENYKSSNFLTVLSFSFSGFDFTQKMSILKSKKILQTSFKSSRSNISNFWMIFDLRKPELILKSFSSRQWNARLRQFEASVAVAWVAKGWVHLPNAVDSEVEVVVHGAQEQESPEQKRRETASRASICSSWARNSWPLLVWQDFS